MIRLLIVASMLAGCRVSLEDDNVARSCDVSTTSQVCMDAVGHDDLAWLEKNVFGGNCATSGCHNGSQDTPQGKLDLTAGKSCAHLVDYASKIEPARKLVVPNDVEASYLMLMLGAISPDMASPPGKIPEAGLMPQNQPILCCQKLDAVRSWIEKGAPCN